MTEDAMVTKSELKAALREEREFLTEELGKMCAHMDARFDAIDLWRVGVDARFEGMDERFAQVDRRFAQMDERFDQIDKRFERLDGRMQGIIEIFGDHHRDHERRLGDIERRARRR